MSGFKPISETLDQNPYPGPDIDASQLRLAEFKIDLSTPVRQADVIEQKVSELPSGIKGDFEDFKNYNDLAIQACEEILRIDVILFQISSEDKG
jgi:hypothetical protein